MHTYNKIFKKPNVVSVGVGYKHINNQPTKEICIIVGVTKKIKNLSIDQLVPSYFKGIRTDVIEVGIPRLVSTLQLHSGDGVGPETGGTGTITCWVKDKDNRDMILSNYHVLGESGSIYHPNNKGIEIAQVWKHIPVLPILKRRAEVSNRSVFIKISTIFKYLVIGFYRKLKHIKDPQNQCDAAVALVTNDSIPSNYIPGIGNIKGVGQATVGEKVLRRGITSGTQSGNVLTVNSSLTLNFNGRLCNFTDVIILGGRPADYGDSGSIVLDKDGLAIGMVFAAGLVTFCLPIYTALKALDVHLKTDY